MSMIIAGTCMLATEHLISAGYQFVVDRAAIIKAQKSGQEQPPQNNLWTLCHVSVAALTLWGRGHGLGCLCGSVLSLVVEVKDAITQYNRLTQRENTDNNPGNLKAQKIRYILYSAFHVLLAFGVFSAAPQMIAGGLVGRALLLVRNKYDQEKRNEGVTYAEVWTTLAIQLTLMAGAWYGSPLLIGAATVGRLVDTKDLWYYTAVCIKQVCGFN